jgi:TldD protein
LRKQNDFIPSVITHASACEIGVKKLLKELLTKINDAALMKFGAEYAEARAQSVSKTMLTVKEGRVEAAKQGIESGVALRVLANGAWGFASVGSLNPEILLSAVSEACRMAKAASLRLKMPIALAKTKVIEDRVQVKPKKNPSEISMEEKIKTAMSLSSYTLGFDKRVQSFTIDYLDSTGTSYFANSEGAWIEQDKLYVWARLTAAAKEKGVFTFSREEIGSTGGYEVFDTETPEIVGKRLAKRAVEQLDAKPPKGGVSSVVFGSNVVGVFVHEE